MSEIREMPGDFDPEIKVKWDADAQNNIVTGRYEGGELGFVLQDVGVGMAKTLYALRLALWQAAEYRRLGLRVGDVLG